MPSDLVNARPDINCTYHKQNLEEIRRFRLFKLGSALITLLVALACFLWARNIAKDASTEQIKMVLAIAQTLFVTGTVAYAVKAAFGGTLIRILQDYIAQCPELHRRSDAAEIERLHTRSDKYVEEYRALP
jgi:hypothetical protein